MKEYEDYVIRAELLLHTARVRQNTGLVKDGMRELVIDLLRVIDAQADVVE